MKSTFDVAEDFSYLPPMINLFEALYHEILFNLIPIEWVFNRDWDRWKNKKKKKQIKTKESNINLWFISIYLFSSQSQYRASHVQIYSIDMYSLENYAYRRSRVLYYIH